MRKRNKRPTIIINVSAGKKKAEGDQGTVSFDPSVRGIRHSIQENGERKGETMGGETDTKEKAKKQKMEEKIKRDNFNPCIKSV